MSIWKTIRYWFYRATGQRRRAGSIQAWQTRKSRSFVERSSRGESPGVVNEEPSLLDEQNSNYNADIAASLARRP